MFFPSRSPCKCFAIPATKSSTASIPPARSRLGNFGSRRSSAICRAASCPHRLRQGCSAGFLCWSSPGNNPGPRSLAQKLGRSLYVSRFTFYVSHCMSLNTDLSGLFSTMADIMDIKGENTFKVLAFRKVGRILADLSFDVRECIKNNTLCDIEGIGPSSQKIIEEYVATGRSSDFESLSQSVPATLLPLLAVEGLGPKTISLLWKERKITNADQLKAALEDGSLKGIKTIGDKKLAAIKQGLENRAKSAGRIGIGHALPVAEMFVEQIRQLPGVVHAEYAGSLRRGRETIGDLDIIASVKD